MKTETHDCYLYLKKWINQQRRVTAYTCQKCKTVWKEESVKYERVKRGHEPGISYER